MRAAHDRYKSASLALDALTALSPATDNSPARNLQIESAAAEQRSAFEQYIEARLELSEAVLSRQNAPPGADTLEDEEEEQSRWRGVQVKIALVVAAAFLLPTAFGIGYLMHQRAEIRSLQDARDEARTALGQTRSQVAELANRVQTLKASVNARAARPAAPAPSRTRTKRASSRPPLPKPLPPGGMIARNHDEVVELQKQGDRNYREFTLTPARSSGQVGPVGLEVLKVDPQRRFFDVAITVDNLPPRKTRVSLYEPVWIDMSGRSGSIELVVNRIDGDKVQGYLSEPRYSSMSWLAPLVRAAGLR
jgi:hypothetical protein